MKFHLIPSTAVSALLAWGGVVTARDEEGLLLGHGAVFDATRDDQELALFEPQVPIPKLHAEPACGSCRTIIKSGAGLPSSKGTTLIQQGTQPVTTPCSGILTIPEIGVAKRGLSGYDTVVL
jgi:hypothetical protein